jgi:hypothetical protein
MRQRVFTIFGPFSPNHKVHELRSGNRCEAASFTGAGSPIEAGSTGCGAGTAHRKWHQLRALLQARRLKWTLLALATSACWAQTTLSLGSGVSAASGTVALGLTFNDPGSTNQVAGLQWTLTYPTTSITTATIIASPALTAESISITCAPSPGQFICVANGPNGNVIANGLVATLQFTLSANAVSSTIGLSGALAASVQANTVSVSAAGGAIAVLPTLTSLACNPTS